MYITYTTDGKYASAAVSSRDKNDHTKTNIEYIYLGQVLDRERGIYKSREHGIFTFNVETQEYGVPPEAYVPPKKQDKRSKIHISVDFGDAWLINSYLYKSGIMDVIRNINYGNQDTLCSMILFYTLSEMANCNAISWYEGSIARMIYPNANLNSQRISDFLAAIGTTENQLAFQEAFIKYVTEHYNQDKNILIDSSGLPNSIHGSMTHYNVHNGKVSREIRLIFVVQRSTGIPLYYKAVPGNIVDVSTLARILAHVKELGLDISSCIMDAGYNSSDNLDLFYDENHGCKIGFITRIAINDKQFTSIIKEELGSIDNKENLIKYNDRFIFMIHRKVMVGKNKDNPAWIYLGLDVDRAYDEQHKLIKKAREKQLSLVDVYEAMQIEGFFGILSGTEYTNEEILPAYYQRQLAEQVFDVAKNYTKLLPLRTNNDATFEGHLLLSYIATCVVKMIQLRLKEENLYLGSRLSQLRNQKCTIYANTIVTDTPQKEARDTFQIFGIDCPVSIPIVDDKLKYETPIPGTLPPEKKRRQKRKVIHSDALLENIVIEPKKRGRPKGSKNKSTIEKEKLNLIEPQVKRHRGRPIGSKNKKTLRYEAIEKQTVKKRRGRPIGSKNKKTLEFEKKLGKKS